MVQPTTKRGKDPASDNVTPTKRRKVGSSPSPDVRSSPTPTINSSSKRQTRSNSGNILNGDPSSNLSAAESHKRRVRPNKPGGHTPTAETTLTSDDLNLANTQVEECSPALVALRQSAAQKKMDLVKKLMVQKEKELMELLYLESGGNMVDFDSKSPAMKEMLNNYHATHGSVFMLDEPVKKPPRPNLRSSVGSTTSLTESAPSTPSTPVPVIESVTEPTTTPSKPKPKEGVVATTTTTSSTPATPVAPSTPTTTTTSTTTTTTPATPIAPATPIPTPAPTPAPTTRTPAAPTLTPATPTPTPATPTPAILTTPAKPTAFPSIFSLPAPITEADIARAVKDAATIRRVGELQRDGLWSLRRVAKAPEPARTKVHWDFLLDEMEWLANDFREERKWKMALAKKISKGILKYHQLQATKEERKIKEEELHIRKLAATVSKEIKKFWQKIEKLVLFKHQAKVDEKKREVMDKHLDFLVGQTERYSFMLAKDLNRSTESVPSSSSKVAEVKSEPMEVDKVEGKEAESEEEEVIEREPSFTKELLSEEAANDTADMAEDAEFLPTVEPEEDDEATLDEEENKGDVDMPTGDDEIARLQKESTLPIHEVLQTFEQNEEAEEDGDSDDERTGKEKINDAAAAATEAQPTGWTLSTTSVKTKVPFLLRGTLREYQHIGLDWLVTMYDKRLNGILADEMGLGKTIQTISLLAHLACERGIWGPHLIVVPTSVMLNWELEFKKWCPAFKILTYYGTQKERKLKRQGWSKTNSFHVCITSYKVVMQDQTAFRRKKWKYFILDEAHNIKNFKSQRWQVLLNFNSKRRLLLTGTPLQNNLMELWSLMHFLMPHIFQSHKEFKDWFSNPVNSMIEGTDTLNEDLISRLHGVLRPFILRRLKKDVEKQMPNKYHHVVNCQLSKRQRFLYEEFMASAGTQDTLKSGNFLGIINVLMQLRKVCNHPDLFEVRPIVSPFDMSEIVYHTSSAVCRVLEKQPLESVDLSFFTNLCALEELTTFSADRITQLQARTPRIVELSSTYTDSNNHLSPNAPLSGLEQMRNAREERMSQQSLSVLTRLAHLNELRCNQRPIYGLNLHRLVQVGPTSTSTPTPSSAPQPPRNVHLLEADPRRFGSYPTSLAEIVKLPAARAEEMQPVIENFVCIIPKARGKPVALHTSHPNPSTIIQQQRTTQQLIQHVSPTVDIFRPSHVRTQLYFPDKRLVQYDCGKLQQLDLLLRTLKAGGHRALIFTQMTRMLDVFEIFLNIHGHTYLRLDGSTKIEMRQQLTERFNADPKIFVFILSTRSGGLGINLTGADTVIFYDSDWNPAMDAQAQDRSHRIGQTRDVHIYRLITEYTIEENILKKANQKRHLDDVIIKGGGFTTEFFKNTDIREIFNETRDQIDRESAPVQFSKTSTGVVVDEPKYMSQQEWDAAVANAEDESDVLALKQAQREQAEEGHEFEEDTSAPQESGEATPQVAGEENTQELYQFTEEDNAHNTPHTRETAFAFEDELLPVQRYALHFLEVVNPVIDQGSLEAMENAVELKQQEWELENLKRLKEEEEERMSEDDELLFYEITPELKAKILAEIQVYGPPDPDEEILYRPSFDGDTSFLFDMPPTHVAMPEPPEWELVEQLEAAMEEEIKNSQPTTKKQKKSQSAAAAAQDDASEVPLPIPHRQGPGRPSKKYKAAMAQQKNAAVQQKKATANHSNPTSPVPSPIPEGPPTTTKSSKSESKPKKAGRPPKAEPEPKRKRTSKPTSKKQEEQVAKGEKEREDVVVQPWTTEEDDSVVYTHNIFGGNWDLICDILCSNVYLPSKVFRRTAAQCAERWTSVLQLKEAEKIVPPSPPLSVTVVPSTAIPLRFSILDAIRGMVHQKKDIPGRSGSASVTNKQHEITHVSHSQEFAKAGITTTKPPSPGDIISTLTQRMSTAAENSQKYAYRLDTKLGVPYGIAGALEAQATAQAIAAQTNNHSQQPNLNTNNNHPNNQPGSQPQVRVPLVVGGAFTVPLGNPTNATVSLGANANNPIPTTGNTTTPTSNSIILNTHIGSQTSRLAQINQVVAQNTQGQPGINPQHLQQQAQQQQQQQQQAGKSPKAAASKRKKPDATTTTNTETETTTQPKRKKLTKAQQQQQLLQQQQLQQLQAQQQQQLAQQVHETQPQQPTASSGVVVQPTPTQQQTILQPHPLSAGVTVRTIPAAQLQQGQQPTTTGFPTTTSVTQPSYIVSPQQQLQPHPQVQQSHPVVVQPHQTVTHLTQQPQQPTAQHQTHPSILTSVKRPTTTATTTIKTQPTPIQQRIVPNQTIVQQTVPTPAPTTLHPATTQPTPMTVTTTTTQPTTLYTAATADLLRQQQLQQQQQRNTKQT